MFFGAGAGAEAEKKIFGAGAQEKWLGSTTLVITGKGVPCLALVSTIVSDPH